MIFGPVRFAALVVGLAAAVAAAGCGSSKSSAPAASTAAAAGASSASATTARGAGATTAAAPSAAALQAEAQSKATGDIPDTQIFLVYRNAAAGYSIKYPEGWAQAGRASSVTLRDKNNIVRVVVGRGRLPTSGEIVRSLRAVAGARVTAAPHALALAGGRAIAVTYTTRSAPNPVTGKSVTLTVDRYYVLHASRVAVVDLGTPVGVDNVDAYRMMIHSFRWR
jgi:hypothetical protein